MEPGEKFELKKEHIDLLSEMRWEDAEWGSGSPTSDAKRPYGNSGYQSDVCEILDWDEPEDGWTDEQYEEAAQLHGETRTALEIILQLKTFKPGTYVKDRRYGKTEWRKA